MSFSLALVTAPASEPLTRTEAKLHLRVDSSFTDDDSLIDALITAARQHVESHTRRALVTQTWDLFLDAFPAGNEICVPLPTLQSVTSLKYTDSAGAVTTWSTSNYIVDTAHAPGRIVPAYGVYWPVFTPSPSNPVAVRFVAGYGAAAAVPEAIKAALELLIGHWYENREAVIGIANSTALAPVPLAVEALLAPYRVWGF